MFSSIATIAAYLAVAAGIAGLARALGRALPRGVLVACALFPLLLVVRGLVSEQTLLPIDHGALIAPWHPPGFVPPRNLFLQDLTTQYLPWAKTVRDIWLAGELPLRDRWNGCGAPLAANGLSAAFSPLVLAILVFPLAKAFAWLAAVKLFLALVGTWLWLRELGASPGSALFGAVAFSLSFSMFPWIFYVQSAVVCLWTWALFALELQRDGRLRARGFWLLAALLTILTLQGHLESVAMGLSFAGLLLIGRWILGGLPEAPRLLRSAVLAGLLAVSLSGFLLLPQALAILASNRIDLVSRPYWAPIHSWRPHGPHWPAGFLTTLFPRVLGDGITSPLLPAPISTFPEMALGHIGIVAWAAALLVLRPGSRRHPATASLVLLAATGLGIASGAWPFAEIQGNLPLIRFLFPVRLLSWTALAGCALAALETDRLGKDLATSRRPAVFAAGLASALLLAGLAAHLHYLPAYRAGNAAAQQRNALALAAAGLSVFAVLVASCRRRLLPALPYVLSLAAGAELGRQGLRQFEYGPARGLFPQTPLIRFLDSRPRPFRVVGDKEVLFPNTNVFAGVEDVRTHDAVERRDYVEFLDAACGYPPADYIKFIGNLDARVFDFLNVRYLVRRAGEAIPGERWRPVYDGPDGTVFENRDVLPRVFAPASLSVIAANGAGRGWVRNAVRDFGLKPSQIAAALDGSGTAWILGDRGVRRENGAAEVSDYRESTNRASFRVRCPSATVLVASLVQDGGWRARDERGRPVETTLANGPFLGLFVEAGEHRITLSYLPPGWRLGAAISGAAWGGLLLRFSLRRLRPRREASPDRERAGPTPR